MCTSLNNSGSTRTEVVKYTTTNILNHNIRFLRNLSIDELILVRHYQVRLDTPIGRNLPIGRFLPIRVHCTKKSPDRNNSPAQ